MIQKGDGTPSAITASEYTSAEENSSSTYVDPEVTVIWSPSSFDPFDNTIEKVIYNIVQSKKRVIDTVMGDHIEEDDLMLNILEEMQSL